MKHLLRPFCLLLLCLSLAAGSAAMAVARAQAVALSRGGTTVVICSGYGLMTITLDADGKPVGPVHPCPKCLAGLAGYILPSMVLPLPLVRPARRVEMDARAALLRRIAVLSPCARDPPQLV
ncbi:hypothetical protein [Pseudorhodobacter sp.]|uniref:hypothetical protein n=1 Tax=Pseudorhodobacter sp. TaxID=1934400 RepID=UPI002649A7E4|nr:hypothetical protein [Pseudorhodobacter sp.]MDN5786705.1 hypothetical protein [Pseudorhodobacter sp.]